MKSPRRHRHSLRFKDPAATAGTTPALASQDTPGVDRGGQGLLLGVANTAVDLTVGTNKHLAVTAILKSMMITVICRPEVYHPEVCYTDNK